MAAEDPDLVIIATGSTPIATDVPIAQGATVLTILQALAAEEDQIRGKHVVVIDDGTGGWPTLNAAEAASLHADHVTVVTSSAAVGTAIPHESIAALHQRLRGAGVHYQTFAALTAIETKFVHLLDVSTKKPFTLPADVVIVNNGNMVVTGPADELRDRGTPVRLVGDALAPRKLTDAMFDANRVLRDFVDAETAIKHA